VDAKNHQGGEVSVKRGVRRDWHRQQVSGFRGEKRGKRLDGGTNFITSRASQKPQKGNRGGGPTSKARPRNRSGESKSQD